ncbi:unnamed protein product [Diamesa serratosioi]
MSTRSAEKRRTAPASSKDSNPVISARGKLKGVLNALQTEEREEEANTSGISTKKAKAAVKTEVTESNTGKEKIDKKSLKEQQDKQQQSYIMKLFDRSVNLAKFEEGTPLYPLCRSWMANNPRQITTKIKKEPEEKHEIKVQSGDVTEMPKVILKPKQLLKRKEFKLNKKALDKIDSEIWTKEKLIEFHRDRWTEERDRIIDHAKSYEDKYFTTNLEILTSLEIN